MEKGRYYFKTIVDIPYVQAVEKVREALAEEGFGVLTEIDVKAILKKKLDVDFKPYIILGACNPSLAYKTLQIEEQIGLMLPCNVVVQEGEDGKTLVSAISPEDVMRPVGNEELAPIANEVSERLQRVLEAL